jgi:hypothetical protein
LLPTFPTPADLRTRYEAFKGIDSAPGRRRSPGPVPRGRRISLLLSGRRDPGGLGEIARNPRVARVLLSLATGTGTRKTVIATYLLHKLAEAGSCAGRSPLRPRRSANPSGPQPRIATPIYGGGCGYRFAWEAAVQALVAVRSARSEQPVAALPDP